VGQAATYESAESAKSVAQKPCSFVVSVIDYTFSLCPLCGEPMKKSANGAMHRTLQAQDDQNKHHFLVIFLLTGVVYFIKLANSLPEGKRDPPAGEGN
jgi:hypothetical protein